MPPKPRKRSATRGLQLLLVFVGKLHEDSLKTWRERANVARGDVVLEQLGAQIGKVVAILDQRVDRLTKNGSAADSRNFASHSECACHFRRADFHALCACGLNIGNLLEFR